MDPIKKRKLDENGITTTDTTTIISQLTPTDARKILETFSHDQLLDILQSAVSTHPDVLDSVRLLADRDVTQRKLFIRGLGWETTSDSLRSVFSPFGELEEAVVILDKVSGKSKGYGFVTYKHIDGAVLALKEPSKKIDGRVAVAQLASAGLSGGPAPGGGGPGGGMGSDTSLRKIYVGNVPYDMPAERLLSVFSAFGEIEEGPLGFDKATGKSKGFALFVYKTPEAAQAALVEQMKMVDGRQLVCKLASDGKKGKPVGEPGGMPPSGPYGGPGGSVGPGGYSSYGGYAQQPGNPMNSGYGSSMGGQGPGGYGGNAGYGSGAGGYGSGAGGYGGGSNYGGPGAGPNSGGYGGYGGGVGSGAGSGMGGGAARGGYGMPANPGAGGGGYAEGGHYGLGSGGGYPGPQPTGNSPAPRVPPGGAGGYPNPPPYY